MFAPCTLCRRHVRVADAKCPFCGGAVGEARYTPRGRSPRAAILFASAVGIAGCGSDYDDSNVVALYGVPADDTGIVDAAGPDASSNDTASSNDATDDTTVSDTAAPDTSATDAPADSPADAKDSGAPVPPYGAPFDSGGA